MVYKGSSSINFDKYKDDLKCSSGTIVSIFEIKELYNPAKSGLIFQTITGSIIYRLERDENLNLKFYRSAPSTGTRLVQVNIRELAYSKELRYYFSWTPEKLLLAVGLLDTPKKLLFGKEVVPDFILRLGRDGSVFTFGNSGARISDFLYHEEGKDILQPTAIETWEDNLKSIETLWNIKISNDNFSLRNILFNTSLVVLVTGFESYCKKRFLEMEQEGEEVNLDQIIKNFISKKERDNNSVKTLYERANINEVPILEQIVNERRINFQNFDKCKLAFKKGYGISFYQDLNIKASDLDIIIKIIKYRHRLIHHSISETTFLLDMENASMKETTLNNLSVFKKTFNEFIVSLHKASCT